MGKLAIRVKKRRQLTESVSPVGAKVRSVQIFSSSFTFYEHLKTRHKYRCICRIT